jgi:hypothetical protein
LRDWYIDEVDMNKESEPVAWITSWVQRYRAGATPTLDRCVSFVKETSVPNPVHTPLYLLGSRSRERELLEKVLQDSYVDGNISLILYNEISDFLAKPEVNKL